MRLLAPAATDMARGTSCSASYLPIKYRNTEGGDASSDQIMKEMFT